MQQYPPRTISKGQIIWQQALIFGFSAIGFSILLWALDSVTHMGISLISLLIRTYHTTPVQASFIAYILIQITPRAIAGLVLFFLAGLFAAKRTGKLETGVLAGLCAGLIYAAFALVFSMIILFAVTLPLFASMPLASQMQVITSTIVSSLVSSLLITGLLIGSLSGLIGGLIGQSVARPRSTLSPSAPQPYAQPPQQQSPYSLPNSEQWKP
jgi:hypothetical protein